MKQAPKKRDRRFFLQTTGGVLAGGVLVCASLPFSAQAKFDILPERARETRFLGNADAAVTVAEYFSMTCGHCGNFHRNTFPEIKEKLINSIHYLYYIINQIFQADLKIFTNIIKF